jgi:hypothetical protein
MLTAEATEESKLVLTFATKGVTTKPDDGEREGELDGDERKGEAESAGVGVGTMPGGSDGTDDGVAVGTKLGETDGVADGMPVRSHPETLNRNAVVRRFQAVWGLTRTTEPWIAMGIDALGAAVWLRYFQLSDEEEL